MFCQNCGQPIGDQDEFCVGCGSRQTPAPRPSGAVPFAAQTAPGAKRQGNLLFVPLGVALPPYCVRCGAPSTGEPIKQNYRWHPSWVYLLILPGVLIYLIVAAIVSKKCILAVPVCDAHRRQRLNFLLVGLALLLMCVPIGLLFGRLVGGADDVGWSLLMIVVLFFTSIFMFAARALLQPKMISDTHALFKKAGENFLNMLPEAASAPAS